MTSKENLIKRMDFSQVSISPYGIFMVFRDLEPKFKQIFESENRSEFHAFLNYYGITDFKITDLFKYFIPEWVNLLFWSIQEEQELIIKFFNICLDLYKENVVHNYKNNYKP